jgi:lipoate-protein ligase B
VARVGKVLAFNKWMETILTESKAARKARGCRVFNLGIIDFAEASQLQSELIEQRLAGKIPDVILLLQHPPVITIGAFGGEQNIIVPRDVLEKEGISVTHTDRGGDVTYHGPGQLVGYLILDLKARGRDVHQYVHDLEEVVIRTLGDYSINAHRDPDYPGIWVGQEKICALGIRVVHWVTKHGFALNVNNDLKPFSYINPCGIVDRGVTSMRQLLGQELEIRDVTNSMIRHFSAVFGINVHEAR